MTSIPAFEHTPIDKISNICGDVRNAFLSHKTRPIEFRLQQLRKLYWGLKDHREAIVEACKKDIGKSSFETYLTESSWCENDIIFMCNNLEAWAKDEKAPDGKLMDTAFSPRIRKEPLGTVLVIGAYNFPIQLSLGPVIVAIAAGCTVVLKPSENAPHAGAVMQKILAEYLDPTCYTTIQGAVPETTAVLDQKWDKIFYTGSEAVGKIIAKKAAETLTPITLELGGRNPAIVTKNADPRLAARRLMWAKCLNAGQVCVSQNYTLIDKSILPAFIEQVKKALGEFFPDGPQKSADYGRIVNKRQFDRLKKLLESTKGTILHGGHMDEADLYIEPTVVQVNDEHDPLLADESFGPLIPVLAVNDIDEAIRIANSVHDTPLGIYPFGTTAETDKILNQTRSGGASVNDGFYHASIPTLQFGGVGTSGQGAYRGRASFECFTHRRSVTTTPGWIEGLLDVRYPPYNMSKQKQFARLNEATPNFDRQGRAKASWGGWLIGLGANSKGSGLVRWAVLIALAYATKHYMQRTSKL
ncbi:fatty aldehyde dehydrogenase [Pseudovirgaria hyperparasitica]|uniref:Aldehyde dehydrogenase n=1 Tax=Pseudovirgaria hyperparasitica TaxID=470096 RepID=A0A6A6VU04_9PEZI|nr:fatty aldehyde dehydrogenase [Pseudovirgaria hyperparasitica]KAF2753276.1 fatty aldehyde dehydrogenase [Pseudovirgaria hyperparasitica]